MKLTAFFLSMGLLASISTGVLAEPWSFDKPLEVTTASGAKIFHHLESSGRRNIAVSGQTIAIAWEDDRDGTPRVYLARKSRSQNTFTGTLQISNKGEAYEPSLLALPDNRFVIAWEEDERVLVRVLSEKGPGPVLQAGGTKAAQASLGLQGDTILLALSDQSTQFGRIMLYRLTVDKQNRLTIEAHCAVDPEPPRDQQTYPTVVAQARSILIGWEDRRPGHTIIMASENKAGSGCAFHRPMRINDKPQSTRSAIYGKGTGAARIAMAGYGPSGVLAVWADKRNFREGYDIFSADLRNQTDRYKNIRVQDAFGSVSRQWHPTIAGRPDGTLVVAWDDDREGTTDITLSWREQGAWSDDLVVPGASGPGEQSHPSITLDPQGNLHITWVERMTTNGPTKLKYLFGKKVNSGK